MNLIAILALAIIAESLTEAIKPLIDPIETPIRQKTGYSIYLYLPVLIGVILAFIFQADLIALLLNVENAAVTTFFTGILLARGANYLHDLIDRIKNKPPRPTRR